MIARIRLAAPLALFLIATIACAQDAAHPLKPPDRSSPRAALETFLKAGDAIGAFLAQDYLPAPSREKFARGVELGATIRQSLDLSEVPPVARLETGRAAALALYEVLNRVQLPDPGEVPDAGEFAKPGGTGLMRWVIPDTEIALVRMKTGPRAGQFLFSADTVARADEFFQRVRGSGYLRGAPLANLHQITALHGGWMIPYAWIQALPAPLRSPLAGGALWKWVGLALILGVVLLFLWLAYRLSQMGGDRNPFLQALAQFAMPVSVIAAMPALVYFVLVQLLLFGKFAGVLQLAATAIMFLAGAWMSWRLAPVVAEAIISTPRIAPESIDAHLIRVTARLLGIVGGVVILGLGADRLGIPVYGIVAGLGVGGLAIALAAQPTIENLIGGLNLFADKPIRVGDFCKYGEDLGTVEAIGIRSTRIRGIDRTLTTIPNAALAKMPIVSYTRRDRMLIHTVIGLRYETSPEQLRYILVKLREMLLGHPRIHPDPARAQLVGFGDSSLDVEIFAYVMTSNWAEFLVVREDVLLRIMEIIEQGGSAIAFPSRTLYLGRDGRPDEEKARAAEASVQAWRDGGTLPFPKFSPEQAERIRGSIDYPPRGSAL